MRAWPLLFGLAAVAGGQSATNLAARGEQIFNRSCATGPCHASKGGLGGGAARLAARGFDEPYIIGVLTRGVPDTAMPAFASQLSRADFAAVVGYLDGLNGVTSVASVGGRDETRAARKLSAEAEKGRALFFEATLGFGRCSTCHQIGAQGIPVASPIASVPANAAALKALKTPAVSTAEANGEAMPALVLKRGIKGTLFYDLTSVPPVLRTMDSASVKIAAGSSWSHASVIGAYSGDADLGSILAFLRSGL